VICICRGPEDQDSRLLRMFDTDMVSYPRRLESARCHEVHHLSLFLAGLAYMCCVMAAEV
jgi:hypothetical protein